MMIYLKLNFLKSQIRNAASAQNLSIGLQTQKNMKKY